MLSLAQKWANFANCLQYENMPKKVIEYAIYRTLDTLGVALAAKNEITTSIITDDIIIQNEVWSSSIWGSRTKTTPGLAAFVNGTMSHTIGLDDFDPKSAVHPGVVVVPACFAAAQAAGVSGKSYLTSLVVAYEIACRIGRAFPTGKLHNLGFHPTSVCGVFGASIGVAKIWNLKEGQIADALGLAGTQAAGLFQFTPSAESKRLHAGFAAQNGLIAANLAKKNYPGPHDIFEGDHGFIRAFSGADSLFEKIVMDSNPPLIENLEKYVIEEVVFKPYAHSTSLHVVADAVIGVLKAANLNSNANEQVGRITITLNPKIYSSMIRPEADKRYPDTIRDAQKNLYFTVGVIFEAWKSGNLDTFIDWYTLEKINDKRIQQFTSKVIIGQDADLEPEEARATIELVNGQHIAYRQRGHRGDPNSDELAFTTAAIVDRFINLAQRAIGKEKAQYLAESILNLPSKDKITLF